MLLELTQNFVLLAGTLIGGATDAKTGYIYDWITYPMIVIGAALALAQQQWFNIACGATIFLVLLVAYKLGKLGGGDVKMLAAIAVLNPQNEVSFLLTTIFFSAITAAVFYSIYYGIKCVRVGINFKQNSPGIKKALIYGAVILAYFALTTTGGIIESQKAAMLAAPILLSLVFVALQKQITEQFFEKKINVKKIEEDEVLAEGKNTKKLEALLFGKKVIGKKEKKILEKNGIREVVVLRGLPPFGPFIFIGVIVALIAPNAALFI